jgi:hypothetical protein
VPAHATDLASFLGLVGTSVADNCDPTPAVTWEGDAISDMTCANRYKITRSYRATDSCGNSATCTQVITVDDQTGPVAVSSGPIGSCYSTQALAEAAALANSSATDVCPGGVTPHAVTSGPPCAATIKVTFTDVCGNVSNELVYNTRIDNTAPVFDGGCPRPTISVSADAGSCTASASTVNVVTPTATDDCPGAIAIYGQRSDNNARSDTNPAGFAAPFPSGGTTITWHAIDTCGNESTCTQSVVVASTSQMLVKIELSPTINTGGTYPQTLQRCITFELWDCNMVNPMQTVNKVLSFVVPAANAPAIAEEVVDVPCGAYTCVTARDKLHTLRRTLGSLPVVGTQYAADFVAANKPLIGGNLNDDKYIDILDFGLYAGQYSHNYGTGNTTCATVGPHGDISGNGSAFTDDFTFIQINFLLVRDANCCGAANVLADAQSQPVTSISVAQLKANGQSEAVLGDLNGDGVLDQKDITAWLQGARPGQPLPPPPKRTR